MRTSGRLLICALLSAFLLSVNSAYASEKRAMGDVVVEKDETVEEVATAWGDVLVEGRVEEDVSSGFGDIRVEGPVGGDVEAGSGIVRISAPVGGDVEVGHGDVYLESGAQVSGNVSRGNGRLYRHPEAVVGGIEPAGIASNFNEDSLSGAFSGVSGWAVMALGLVAAAVLLTVIAPRPLSAAAQSLETSPGRSLILGLGSVPAAVIVSILLAITGVGALLLLLLWPAYLALILFGALVVAYFLGRKVVLVTGRYRAGDAVAAVVGAVLVATVYLIPFLGSFLFAVLVLLGTGAAISALLTRWRPGRSAPHTTYASYEDYLRDRRDG
jgi:hypothetical protein